MPEPLKNVYNPAFFETFTAAVSGVLPRFRTKSFLQQVFNEGWQSKELKQRMRHIAAGLKNHLPGMYKEQVHTIIQIIEQLESAGVKGGFEYMFLPDFVEQYGLNDLKTSLQAMESITQFVSCEFAIRPFLLKHPGEVMGQMLQWSRHPHHHVRRFASEGCRPRLPWAVAIPQLKKDPSAILPILENLKKDESLFVRKSVANNLNDIAKDHPDVVAELAKRWKGVSAETDWVVRHGCRTLLKKAHPSTYALFGLDAASVFEVKNLKLSQKCLRIGDRMQFSFLLKTGNEPSRLRLEYAVYYVKANGEWSRKIFQLTEKIFSPNQTVTFEKVQRLQDFTTRKHYPGQHKLAIVVNGKEVAEKAFVLAP
ncbi:MAG TPA: DNA alkylation repair protein [Flavisolibacter sp.]|nr:DNA alkylation repair protein [Flavisolibacter sp.]